VALKQLCFFDGEITMARKSAWIIFIVEKTISRRKAFRHPTRSYIFGRAIYGAEY